MNYPAPNPPYLGPAKFHGGATNKPIDRITLHSTVGPTKAGSARGIAAYFRDTVTRPSSAHYVVDAAEVVQVVFDPVVAYHAPPNEHSIGVAEGIFLVPDEPRGMAEHIFQDVNEVLIAIGTGKLENSEIHLKKLRCRFTIAKN